MNSASSVPGPGGPAWFKSSYSSEQGGACLEVAASAAHVLVRDSKDPEAGALAHSPAAWAAFTARVPGTSEHAHRR